MLGWGWLGVLPTDSGFLPQGLEGVEEMPSLQPESCETSFYVTRKHSWRRLKKPKG